MGVIKVAGFKSLSVVMGLALLSAPVSFTKVFAHGGNIEEVIVTSTRTDRTLDDTPLRVQILGEEELQEKANMKPGDIRMMLNESTGIQVQQTSATSFNSSIRIQGLDGRYTQMLRDGLPIYSGFSGSLSLLQITPLDLQQVEVVKGASSTLYGGGAIAGMINLVSKTPGHDPETAIMLNGTTARGADLSAFHSREIGAHGVTLFASYNRGEAYEPVNNGLTAIPEFERITVTPRWFYEVSEATKINIGVGFVDEDRLGGSIDYVEGRSPGDYFEANESQRFYTRFGLTHEFKSGVEFVLNNTFSEFDRSLEIPNYLFSGKQRSMFTEANFSGNDRRSSWVAGVNAITDEFDQDAPLSSVGSNASNIFNHQYSEETIGAFGQYTWDLSPAVVFEAGLRVDSHSEYGEFVLPRVSLMLLPLEDLTLRFGGGYGYKTPTVFISDAEEIQFRNLESIDPNNFEGETSKGLNIDINYRLDAFDSWSLTSNVLFFHTKIEDALQVIQDNNIYRFSQSGSAFNTQGVELNLIFGFDELRYVVGYTYVDAREETTTGDVSLPLVSRHRVNQVLIWEREDDFRIGLEAYYYSKQRRAEDSSGRDYWFLGLMTEKALNESVTLFLNFENFTDTRQTRYEDINNGNLENPSFRDIYAPLDGFVSNGGVRVRF